MSSYIRTKDGIYELKDNSKYGDLIKTIGLDNFYSQNCKKSDNLAELCDGFYVQIDDWKFDTTHLYDNLENAIKEAEDWKSYSDRKYLGYEIVIYAFIKTDKGLIYIAKLNDDRELVLI